MDNNKRFEILMRELVKCVNLANEMQVDISRPIKTALRAVLVGHKRAHDLEMEFILARPKTDAIQ
jgi:hypothetical protein